MNHNEYDIDAIESLSFREGVRKRIQMYLGSSTTEGLWQGLKEIINNSTDEAMAGYGNEIIITVNESNQEFSVRDFGRSIPFGIRETGENVLISVFTQSHVGGKFNHKAYAQAVGCNGIGASATCLSSVYFHVESYRDGQVAIADFIDGENTSYKIEPTTEKTGTFIKYRPAEEVFIDAKEPLTYERICQEVENISYLNKKIKFTVIDVANNKTKTFYSENGIADFISNKVKSPIMSTPIICSKSDDTDEVEVALIWTKDIEHFYCFVNGGYCNDGGAPITGIKTSITNTLKRLIKKDIDPEIFRKGLCYVVNCKVQNPSFEGQTKNRINNGNLRTLAGQAVKEGLERFAMTSEFKVISEMLIKLERAERAADRAREAVLNHNKEIAKELKKKTVLAGKLADCRYHDERSQLLIVEGLSALGNIVKSRNSDFTAAFPLTGKIQNVFKNTDDRLLENEVLKNLHTALGCGFGADFSLKKLRYGRVVFMCDMDEDGYSIMCLLLAFMYYYYPQLIEMGKVFWGKTPLFKIVTKAGKAYYAYSETELKKLPAGDITRAKGLGELMPEDFKATIFSDQGCYIPITMGEAEDAAYYFSVLLGEDVESRRKYISAHADFDAFD